MKTLKLLFSKDGLQYQVLHKKKVEDEKAFFFNDEMPKDFITQKLDEALQNKVDKIEVISAMNHFALTPEGFNQHEMGQDLIAYNAAINKDNEELMLSINKKFGVQFYYAFPKEFYHKIKALNSPTLFNFSGEKFLNTIKPKKEQSIHIHLYHHQCEFIALDGENLILYNNLDVDSEVDFLYFIMFTLNKIGFGTNDTRFYIYGETTEHDTFISEIQKFVTHLKIVFDNLHKKNFILN